ncbi:MAG TPA: hypothetical protein VHY08_24320 [Bacillota bacterium]|nr:hypothetical protein [Bacillota bacterium]
MFGWWGYLLWLILGVRVIVYTLWLWRQKFRMGAIGSIILMVITLGILIYGSLAGSGLL